MTKSTALRVADLQQNTPTPFALVPDANARAALAQELGISGLRKLRFEGTIKAFGKRDWALEGKLGATVVQPCVATLDPVTTRIDVPVTRVFVANMTTPEDAEIEMPEDDAAEPLGSHIDPAVVMAEALALALPLYPRKEDATIDRASYTEPGVKPMTDEDARPFAGLAGLRDALKKDS
ncbi:YceD family protein [Phaeobacter marinintestinus]|uniref:YceD family protein n=1 Tax=Falsiphaeobacter marinintestinus TaxID=1492905 RepID=UPI0011B83665|nr:YceD family protein [Phaeobacter marinintestinus]